MSSKLISWIVPEKLAISSFPFNNEYKQAYTDENINVLINLSRQKYEATKIDLEEFTKYHFPITDYSVPNKSQVEDFISTVNEHLSQKDKVLIHCIGGCGRSGVMVAIWLYSYSDFQSPEKTIEDLRSKRECAIESDEQYQFVINYCNENLD